MTDDHRGWETIRDGGLPSAEALAVLKTQGEELRYRTLKVMQDLATRYADTRDKLAFQQLNEKLDPNEMMLLVILNEITRAVRTRPDPISKEATDAVAELKRLRGDGVSSS